jgi:hypothetical protein
MSRQFQSIQGPTDPSLRHSEIEGYQPVSRIGEIVINSFGAPLLLNTHSGSWHDSRRRADTGPKPAGSLRNGYRMDQSRGTSRGRTQPSLVAYEHSYQVLEGFTNTLAFPLRS